MSFYMSDMEIKGSASCHTMRDGKSSSRIVLANLNPLNNDGLASESPLYLVEFSMAVFLGLWDMENLVHVRLPLLPSDPGEQKAGY